MGILTVSIIGGMIIITSTLGKKFEEDGRKDLSAPINLFTKAGAIAIGSNIAHEVATGLKEMFL